MTDLGPERQYAAYLAEGRFMIQRARASGRYVFYPRLAEPGTGDTDLDWVEVSGLGTVHAATTVRQKPPLASYNVSLIDLDEGPRMMSRVVDLAPEEIRIGLRVRARIIREEDLPIVVFAPVAE